MFLIEVWIFFEINLYKIGFFCDAFFFIVGVIFGIVVFIWEFGYRGILRIGVIFCGIISLILGLGKSGFRDRDLVSIFFFIGVCGVIFIRIIGIDVVCVSIVVFWCLEDFIEGLVFIFFLILLKNLYICYYFI